MEAIKILSHDQEIEKKRRIIADLISAKDATILELRLKVDKLSAENKSLKKDLTQCLLDVADVISDIKNSFQK